MQQLEEWKNSQSRKPLLIRGARQTGKTWLMKEFGKRHYQKCAYVNLDLNSRDESGGRLREVFNSGLEPHRIIQSIELILGIEINPTDTLLIFDEIQDQPKALSSLKYFYEMAPEYHIVVAGSHLGMTSSSESSIPVGKISTLYLYPLSFLEFLAASGRNDLVEVIRQEDWEMMNAAHSTFVDLLRNYYCVGGMPEVVDDFQQRGDLIQARVLQRELLTAYRNDFSKHAPPAQLARIWQVWDSIPVHLSKENKKLVWGAVREGSRAKDFELAIQWLGEYGAITKVPRITKPGMPLKGYEQSNHFKLFLLDVGLLGAMSSLDVTSILDGNRLFTEFKGALTEQYVCQQLVAMNSVGHYGNIPYYWSGNTSEIDFILQVGNSVVPIEVKAEENLKSQSLKSYRAKYNPEIAVRSSLSRFRQDDKLINIPLYAIENILTLT